MPWEVKHRNDLTVYDWPLLSNHFCVAVEDPVDLLGCRGDDSVDGFGVWPDSSNRVIAVKEVTWLQALKDLPTES